MRVFGVLVGFGFHRLAAIGAAPSVLENWIRTMFTPHSYTYLLNLQSQPSIFIDRFGHGASWEDVVP